MGKMWRGRFARAGVVAILALISAAVTFFAAPPRTSIGDQQSRSWSYRRASRAPPGTKTVEMFAAMERGDLAVRLMPEKDQQARLELENRTDRPLTVGVPATFGGRFILAGVAAPWPPQAFGAVRLLAAACSAFRRRRSDFCERRPHALTSQSPSQARAWSMKCAALRN